MSADDIRGSFGWYDLYTDDVEGAIAFYRSVVGWGVQAFNPGDAKSFQMFTADERPVGGVNALTEEMKRVKVPPLWLAYAIVPDLEEAQAKVRALGGRILSEVLSASTVGRWCVFTDPQGAAMCLFEPEAWDPGEIAPPAVGHVSWHELMTSDLEAAFAFYSALFGWEVETDMDMGPHGIYRIFKKPGISFPYGGMMRRPAEMPAWTCYVQVHDLDAALKRVKAGGGSVLNGPMTVPGGDRVAQCQDPQGAQFALQEPAAR